MSRLFNTLILGLLTGLLGLIFSLFPLARSLEEKWGLDLLFNLRGVRQAPPEVMVVSIDKLSTSKLNLPEHPDKWPRSLHARLIENLVNEGASIIAFALFFHEARSAEDDRLLAETIRRADNVILSEYLMRKSLIDEGGNVIEDYHIVERVPPIPSLAQSAIAVASFPLPKVPFRVSQYWTFKRAAGDLPTLPVAVFQGFALDAYDDFTRLMKKHSPNQMNSLPKNRESIIHSRDVMKVITKLRNIFEGKPALGTRMLKDLQNSKGSFSDPRKKRLLESLVMMYQGPHSKYLNFYGPSRTIQTVPYYQVLRRPGGNSSANQGQLNFKGKAVFVGLSEDMLTEQRNEGHITVFSRRNGVHISGIEIAATAFANLLEGMPVRSLSLYPYLAVIFLWGLAVSLICRLFPTGISLALVAVMGALYLTGVLYQFKVSGVWYPLVIPLLIQIPFAILYAVVWKRLELNRTMKHFLPHEVMHKIWGGEKIEALKSMGQKVYGTCLITDIEGFTRVSEAMDPEEIDRYKKRYFELVFDPLKKEDLLIRKTTGDGIVAAWNEEPGAVTRRSACIAALNVKNRVHQFNQSSQMKFPTRIGMHCGHMSLGIVGADGHYEYDLSGDTVNTTKRIEEVNKTLGTQILLSKEVLNQLDGLLTRDVGEFVLTGKSKPFVLHELICLMEESTQRQRSLCLYFSEAVDAFRRLSWEEASRKFKEIITRFGQDGPSQYYIPLCELYLKYPPGELWEDEIRLNKKRRRHDIRTEI